MTVVRFGTSVSHNEMCDIQKTPKHLGFRVREAPAKILQHRPQRPPSLLQSVAYRKDEVKNILKTHKASYFELRIYCRSALNPKPKPCALNPKT